MEHLGVELVDHVRPGVEDPTLGIDVPPGPTTTAAHRLVTVGDSLTHGFHHFAIFDTEMSWPAIVAHQLGILDRFRFPTFDGPGGHPLNLERVARRLSDNPVGTALSVWRVLEEAEDWYERGPGSSSQATTTGDSSLCRGRRDGAGCCRWRP